MTDRYLLNIVIALLFILIYTVPTVMACEADHPKKRMILLVNLFFGWTGIGWFVSLYWSLRGCYFYFDRFQK